jgi:integrase
MRKKSQGFYFDKAAGSWVVQAARTGPDGRQLRRCRRIRGTAADARACRAQMTEELEVEVNRLIKLQQREEEIHRAATVLGIQHPALMKQRESARLPTLREYLVGRWAQHVLVSQNVTTRRTTKSHVAYLTFFLGGRRLDEIDEAAVALVREGLFRDGPRSFALNKSGEPRKRRSETFTPTAVNRILATLAAALNLAERERLIERAPRVDLLPRDESEPIVPPSDDELDAILKAAADFREIAPVMPEAIELAAETGMRAGEQFTLSWRSVDFSMGETGAIRIEKQPRAKLIDGQPWRPKYKKSRTIPLTPRARELLLDLRARGPNEPDAPVIPSRGGSPYNRLEAAPDKAGKGFFPDVVEAAGLAGRVRWHDLRHFFAVRALMRGVPMAVVSAWLGHSDINLTVKRYGRWAAESREQWSWAKKMGTPIDAIGPRPALGVIDGGRDTKG